MFIPIGILRKARFVLFLREHMKKKSNGEGTFYTLQWLQLWMTEYGWAQS